MAVETELKLRIDPGQLPRLKRHELLKSLSASRPVARRLQNIYYDTPKLDLHGSGMALRLRRAGGQWLQTLKGGGSVHAGLHSRDEWEVPVTRAALDFSATQAVDWDRLLRPSLRKRLEPVFVTDFARNSRMLDFQGAQIELCIDSGEVRTEQRNAPICELELELKSGEPRTLFELALAILEIVPFELESVSKAEQGYRLLAGYTEHPVKGVAPALAGTDTLAEVLKKLAWSCMQHFQDNLHGAMASDDDEYLHQMRVALRRLRVALRMAEKIHADQRLAGLYKDVSELCIALGRIREWDVFIAQTVQPMCARMAGHAGLQALLAAGERQRAICYAALRTRHRPVNGSACCCVSRSGCMVIIGGNSLAADESMPHARDFAARRLRKLAKRFALSGQQLKLLMRRGCTHCASSPKNSDTAPNFSHPYLANGKLVLIWLRWAKCRTCWDRSTISRWHTVCWTVWPPNTAMAGPEAVVLARGWIAHELSGLSRCIAQNHAGIQTAAGVLGKIIKQRSLPATGDAVYRVRVRQLKSIGPIRVDCRLVESCDLHGKGNTMNGKNLVLVAILVIAPEALHSCTSTPRYEPFGHEKGCRRRQTCTHAARCAQSRQNRQPRAPRPCIPRRPQTGTMLPRPVPT